MHHPQSNNLSKYGLVDHAFKILIKIVHEMVLAVISIGDNYKSVTDCCNGTMLSNKV